MLSRAKMPKQLPQGRQEEDDQEKNPESRVHHLAPSLLTDIISTEYIAAIVSYTAVPREILSGKDDSWKASDGIF